jgi:hypothetical protein
MGVKKPVVFLRQVSYAWHLNQRNSEGSQASYFQCADTIYVVGASNVVAHSAHQRSVHGWVFHLTLEDDRYPSRHISCRQQSMIAIYQVIVVLQINITLQNAFQR